MPGDDFPDAIPATDVPPEGFAEAATSPEEKPKKGKGGRKPKAAPVAAADSDTGDVSDAPASPAPTVPGEMTYMVHVHGARDKVLETPKEVKAVSPADAKEKYMAEMGIQSVDESDKKRLRIVVSEK